MGSPRSPFPLHYLEIEMVESNDEMYFNEEDELIVRHVPLHSPLEQLQEIPQNDLGMPSYNVLPQLRPIQQNALNDLPHSISPISRNKSFNRFNFLNSNPSLIRNKLQNSLYNTLFFTFFIQNNSHIWTSFSLAFEYHCVIQLLSQQFFMLAVCNFSRYIRSSVR